MSSIKNTDQKQYKKAGVDVIVGEKLVDWLKNTTHHANQSHALKANPLEKHLISGIGGFASIFRLPPGYKNPCLVSCMDGVGTKILMGLKAGKYQGLGQDLVAMCLNDLIVQGATPLFFLDYFAAGHLDLHTAQDFLLGVQRACQEGKCLLVGGETAEMPGFYEKGQWDCVGCAIGVVEEDQIISGQQVQVGDVVLGIESSGFHSNGYSLLRKIFADDLDAYMDELLTPTRLYVEPVCDLLQKGVEIHAMAHITGGGMDNIGRSLKKGVCLTLKDWKWPPLYEEIQGRIGMTAEETLKTFNCGVGFVLIVPPTSVVEVKKTFLQKNWTVQNIGVLQACPADSPSLKYHLNE